MVNLSEIIKRVKKHLNIKTNKEYADIIGISPPDLSKRKKSGTLLPLIVEWGVANKVNLQWLITGEGEMIREDKKGSLYNKVEPDEDPEIVDLLSRTVEILRSDTDYSASLSANIRSFHHAVKMEGEVSGLKSRVTALEDSKKILEKIRREDPPGKKEEFIKRRAM